MSTLRELAEKATPGPWIRVTEGNASVEQAGHRVLHDLLVPLPDGIPPSTDTTFVRTGDDTKNVAFIGNGPRQTDNGDFIAACSPDVILRLLDVAEEIVRLGNQPGMDDDEWEQAMTVLEAALS